MVANRSVWRGVSPRLIPRISDHRRTDPPKNTNLLGALARGVRGRVTSLRAILPSRIGKTPTRPTRSSVLPGCVRRGRPLRDGEVVGDVEVLAAEPERRPARKERRRCGRAPPRRPRRARPPCGSRRRSSAAGRHRGRRDPDGSRLRRRPRSAREPRRSQPDRKQKRARAPVGALPFCHPRQGSSEYRAPTSSRSTGTGSASAPSRRRRGSSSGTWARRLASARRSCRRP